MLILLEVEVTRLLHLLSPITQGRSRLQSSRQYQYFVRRAVMQREQRQLPIRTYRTDYYKRTNNHFENYFQPAWSLRVVR